jgi:membrane associated rhomboid family serine protease
MIPLRDNVVARRKPFVVWLLIAANVYVFWRELALPREALEQFMHVWGVVPARLTKPGWARSAGYPPGALLTVFSSMFLHGGWLHLISNMWSLWLFGDNVEDRFGHGRFLLFYVLCGVGAMGLHVVLHQASTVPAIGASGAIAGVMGAYFLMFPRARVVVMVPIFFYPLLFEVPAAVFLFVWIAGQVFNGVAALKSGPSAFAGVAFWAHVGGFAAGLALAFLWAGGPRGHGRSGRIWRRERYTRW